jgi:type IV secretory pathway VirB6-like protein
VKLFTFDREVLLRLARRETNTHEVLVSLGGLYRVAYYYYYYYYHHNHNHHIIIIISFMQGVYTYIPETNNVPREYIVAVIPLLLFMVPISLVPALAVLCFYVSTFRSMFIIIIITIIITGVLIVLSPAYLPFNCFFSPGNRW